MLLEGSQGYFVPGFPFVFLKSSLQGIAFEIIKTTMKKPDHNLPKAPVPKEKKCEPIRKVSYLFYIVVYYNK
jgi:hypothetical protein